MASEIQLADPFRQVLKRNGEIVDVENFSRRIPQGKEVFTNINSGANLKTFENLIYEGDNVIGDLIQNYPTLRLIDFLDRPDSSITSAGFKFNLMNSSKISGVAYVISNEIISSNAENLTTITVQNTEKFFDTGYLLSEKKSVLKYTSKTSTTFDCYVVRGSNTLDANDELIQYSFL